MRLLLASIAIAGAAACGSSHSATTDSPSGDGSGSGDGGSIGGTTITVTLNDLPMNAAMFSFLAAYQLDNGTWTAAPAPVNNTYTFGVRGSSWSFAWACIPGNGAPARVELASFTVAEKTSLTETVPPGCTDVLPARVQLTGSVSHVMAGGAGSGYVALWGQRQAIVMVQNTTGMFTMMVEPGTHDLVIAHATVTGGGGGGAGDVIVDSAAIVRGVAAPATTAPLVNFTTATGQTFPVTVATGGAATRVEVSTHFYSAGGTDGELVRDGTAPFETNALGASAAVTGDVYNQQIRVTNNGAASTVQNWTATIAAQTYSAPAALGGATSTVPATTPYPQIQSTWPAYTNASGYVWDAVQGAGTIGGATVEWIADLGPDYLGASPKFQMPDLSALAGWKPGFQFQTGTAVTGLVTAQQSTGGVSDFPPAAPAASGTQRVLVDAPFTVTP
jgi:hypothetical protein